MPSSPAFTAFWYFTVGPTDYLADNDPDGTNFKYFCKFEDPAMPTSVVTATTQNPHNLVAIENYAYEDVSLHAGPVSLADKSLGGLIKPKGAGWYKLQVYVTITPEEEADTIGANFYITAGGAYGGFASIPSTWPSDEAFTYTDVIYLSSEYGSTISLQPAHGVPTDEWTIDAYIDYTPLFN